MAEMREVRGSSKGGLIRFRGSLIRFMHSFTMYLCC